MRIRVVALLAIAAAAMLGTTALLTQHSKDQPKLSSIGGSFELVDHNGKIVTERDLLGKPTLIFFGFTHCPDVCPTALFEMSEIFNRLGPDAEKLSAFFVSVDPERDTPEKLKLYLSSFNSRILGLSGSETQVEQIKKAYYVYAKRIPLEGGSYTMDHTAIVYLMDKNGKFIAPFNMKQDASAAANELRRRL